MTSNQTRRIINLALWLAALFTAALFIVTGAAKLNGMMTDQFSVWGYGASFALAIGMLEFIGAIGLLIPRTAGWAALGLSVVMLGAIGTHVAHGDYIAALVPVALLGLLGFILWGRGLIMEPTTRGHVVATKNPMVANI
jgi:putative oxidoreductase